MAAKKNKKDRPCDLLPSQSVLMIVDVQERLCPAMDPGWLTAAIRQIGLMALFARLENIPIILTEQYPKGLGPTHPDVLAHLQGVKCAYHSKLSFGCAGDAGILKTLKVTKRKSIILTGMETHICVYLTALGLLDRGYRIFVCHDAVIARSCVNHDNGLHLMEGAGAVITNSESAVFQMMGVSGGGTFKVVSAYMKKMAEVGRPANKDPTGT